MSRLRKVLFLSTLCLVSVLAVRGYAAVPAPCSAATSHPFDAQNFKCPAGMTVSVEVSGSASVAVTGAPNEQFLCNWNMFTKCNPTPGTIGKDTSNGFVNQQCDAMGGWKRTASFDGAATIGPGNYTADTFATVQVGNSNMSAENFHNFSVGTPVPPGG